MVNKLYNLLINLDFTLEFYLQKQEIRETVLSWTTEIYPKFGDTLAAKYAEKVLYGIVSFLSIVSTVFSRYNQVNITKYLLITKSFNGPEMLLSYYIIKTSVTTKFNL